MRLEYGARLSVVDWIELATLIALLAAAFLNPNLFRTPARRINRVLDRLARKPVLSCAICFALPIALRLALLPIYPPPEAQLHDEHSFVLQAETFARFRIANPPLAPGDPIEEQYVLLRPARQSVYPPSQAIFLAFGLLFFHSAWAGVLLAIGLMCALVCWSLRQWISPAWAFRAGLYTALFIGVLSYWTNSYWGGAVNAIGGLLMWGAMPRLVPFPRLVQSRKPRAARMRDAVVFAAGFLIAADSRPVESIVFMIIATIWMVRPYLRGETVARFPVRAAAAALFCIAIGAALNAAYDARVTGDPLVPGYIAWQRGFGLPQNFYFQKPVVRTQFDFPDMRNEYERQLTLWRRGRTLRGFFLAAGGKLKRAWVFFVGFPLTPVLFAVPWSLRSKGVAVAFTLVLAPFALHLLFHSFYPHYLACMFGPIALILVQGWRHLRLWKPAGAAICRALPVVAFVGLIAPIAGRIIGGPPVPGKWYASEFNFPAPPRIALDHFSALPGPQLLLVRYSPDHDVNEDWIFNDPDPAQSKIVVARELGGRSDAALVRRFPGRQCWIIDADSRPPQSRPCQPETVAGK